MSPLFRRYFTSERGGAITVTFDEAETGILRNLIGQVLGLLDADEPEGGTNSGGDPLARALGLGAAPAREEPPDDPVLARLFPSAYEDEEAAGEFRRLTEGELREGKRAAARTALDTLGSPGTKIKLDRTEAEAWLRALNDLRLSLGTRLEVTEDIDETLAGLDDDDPLRAAFAVYSWLGLLQETLVEAMMR